MKYLKKKLIQKKKIKIKQPNDILIDNKKICGILIESIKYKKNLYLVIGIGLNLISSPKIKNYITTFLQRYVKNKISRFDFVKFTKQNIKFF